MKRLLALTFLFTLLNSQALFAHCDSMDGPVVKDAKKALESDRIEYVMKWVAPKDERAIRTVFKQSMEVRTKGKTAQMMADQHFFETLVRLHRQSEGEDFSGIKPAGSIDPVLVAIDTAL